MQLDHPNYYGPIDDYRMRSYLATMGLSMKLLEGTCVDAQIQLERSGYSLFDLQAIKYLWRATRKGNQSEDLKKALRYLSLEDSRTYHQQAMADLWGYPQDMKRRKQTLIEALKNG